MSGTFLCPNSCGFAKVAALEIARTTVLIREQGESSTKYKAHLKTEQYNKFKSIFSSDDWERFSIDFIKFHKKLQALREKVNKWNVKKLEEKSKFLDTFSLKKWISLPEARKREHSLANCKGCAIRFSDIQAYFPVNSPQLKAKAKSNPVFAARSAAEKLYTKTPQTKPLKNDIKTAARDMYKAVDGVFEKRFNTSFAEALSKVTELNLQHKSKNERRKERRNHYKQNKDKIEQQMNDTAFLRCYGSGQS
ncbi:uncharacterized protein LOC116290271, partial [Actinia tenebrosa]|uniref:Uncharacterized protein LOC116290271 n=1 Tax=Actinia tenebrosa TaxID=6105 RepID=A0A6P8HDK8_ACTTE